jgi:toxin ParE1/3/4
VVIWSKPARDDLKAIFDYIKKDSRYYAEKVINDFIEKSESLKQFPVRGRIVPEIKEDNIREIFVYSYRMIYEISDDKIYILTIVHFSQYFNKERFLKHINEYD